MEPALKQRLIGAAVLVALAVIFLPMLIKGPAPESGVADVPIEPPAGPDDAGMETRELPLLEPGAAPQGGAVGMPARGVPQAAPSAEAAEAPAVDDGDPSARAAGDWAVSFGSYATEADARRVVEVLNDRGLGGYREAYTAAGGRTLHRVRIGPFATRAEAEAVRVQAAAMPTKARVEVIALDAETPAAGSDAATAAAQPAPARPAADEAVATKPDRAEPAPAAEPKAPARPEPAPSEPAKPTPTQPAPAKPAPAASGVGFAVQVGAFSETTEAERMRERLRAAGFTAFIEPVRTDRGTLQRVRVGPVGTSAEAEQLRAQLAARAGVSGIVRPHP